MRMRKYGIAIFFIAIASVWLTVLLASSVKAAAEDCGKAAKLSKAAVKQSSSNLPEAANMLREAISYCETSAALRYNLAVTLYKMGNMTEAEENLEQALKIKPDYAKALNDLANITYKKPGANRGRAEYLAQRAVSLDSGNQQYRDTLDMIAGNIEIAPRTTAYRPDAIAVIIGNKKYLNTLVPDVKYAHEDIATVKKYLTQTLGVQPGNIIEIKDAPMGEFAKIFGTDNEYRGVLYSRTRKDVSEIFIYYVGHGAPDSINHKAYLVPSDADPTIIRVQGYSLDTLYGNLEKLSADLNPKNITVVLDTCFSGGSSGGTLVQDASPIYIEAVTPVAKLKKTVIFASAKGNQISSWYPEKNHSLFTYFFLKSIKNSIEDRRPLSAANLEKDLTGADGVNDFAWRLYNREQQPQVMGDKSIVYAQ